MPVEHVSYGILDGPERVLLHGCNAQGRFGAGVAKTIADAHPRAKVAYVRAWEKGNLVPGIIIWSSSGKWRIGNAITQEYYGRVPGVRYMLTDALRQCLHTMNTLAVRSTEEQVVRDWFGGVVCRVAMPRIGAGLGGADWQEVEAIIADEAQDFTAVICTPEGY